MTGTTEDRTKLNVDITPEGAAAGVVIDAVVVKGGDGYNVYRDPYLPPGLPSPQHYISPLNNGGKIPDISHWFVCYHLNSGQPNQRAILGKVVIPPPGQPVEDLPTTFTVTVTCDGLAPFDLTFGAGGGIAIAGQDTGQRCARNGVRRRRARHGRPSGRIRGALHPTECSSVCAVSSTRTRWCRATLDPDETSVDMNPGCWN